MSLNQRLRSSNTVTCAGAPASTLRRGLDSASLCLPDAHLSLLSEANGIAGFHGYVRLFGFGCEMCADLQWWNEHETWKFAWKKRLDGFVCFAETAWGDQYAYRHEELESGAENVYVLDAFEMEPELISETFEEFMNREFAAYSVKPYDHSTVAAYRRFGALPWSDHVTYVPSILLGGVESAENIHRLNARASMIINGDIWTDVALTPGGELNGVETFIDERGRLRTRVLWR